MMITQIDRNIKPVKLVEMTLLEFSGFISNENENIKSTEHYSECCVLVHMRRGESFVVKYKDAKDVVGYYVRELFPLIDNKQGDK